MPKKGGGGGGGLVSQPSLRCPVWVLIRFLTCTIELNKKFFQQKKWMLNPKSSFLMFLTLGGNLAWWSTARRSSAPDLTVDMAFCVCVCIWQLQIYFCHCLWSAMAKSTAAQTHAKSDLSLLQQESAWKDPTPPPPPQHPPPPGFLQNNYRPITTSLCSGSWPHNREVPWFSLYG